MSIQLLPFRRRRDGIHVSFASHERALLLDLASQVVSLLDEGDPHDAAVARLLPAGYSGDDEADAEFRRLTVDDLTAAKIANAKTLISTLNTDKRVALTPEAEQAWLRSLTDIRLTLASRLGVTAEGFTETNDPRLLALRDVYEWLGFVQEVFVRALTR